jgi:hypothetical protein
MFLIAFGDFVPYPGQRARNGAFVHQLGGAAHGSLKSKKRTVCPGSFPRLVRIFLGRLSDGFKGLGSFSARFR